MKAAVDFSCDPAWRDIAFREPDTAAVARLTRWLQENPAVFVRLYHGTDAALPILKEGLRPTGMRRRHSPQSRGGYVSFSIYPSHAEWFGQMAFPQRAVTVYAVDFRVGELVPDSDQLSNQRRWAHRDVRPTLAHSLAFGHGAQFRGTVPVERVFAVKTCEPAGTARTVVDQPSVAVRAQTASRVNRMAM